MNDDASRQAEPAVEGHGNTSAGGDAPTRSERSDGVATLHSIAVRAYENATALSRTQRAALLSSCVRAWDHVTGATLYFGGTRDTRDGYRVVGPWQELGEGMTEYATRLVPKKGEGLWLTPALSRNGRCRDQDIECITQLSFDCDGVGEWDVFRDLLTNARLAHILQRSSSHRPDHPKWHAHIPLVSPWSGTKKEWRRIYRHAVAWFSAASEFEAKLEARPPTYGFDTKTDRLGQPWFLAARRTAHGPIPETIVAEGGALELVPCSDRL